jgi:outer membrane protein assembly factor BamB
VGLIGRGHRGRRGLSGVAVALVVLLSGCWWGQPRFEPGWTSYNPFEHTLTAANADQITERWSVDAPYAGGLLSWRNRLFVAGTDGAVHVLDTTTGDQVWQTPLLGGYVVRDGVLYVLAGNVLEARDAVTGARQPGNDIRPFGAPVGDDSSGIVDIGGRHALLLGVIFHPPGEPEDTLRLYDWQAGTSTRMPVSADPADVRVGPIDDAAQQFYLIGPAGGGFPPGTEQVEARSFTGDQRWAYPTFLSFPTAPVVDGGRLYVGNTYTFGNDGFHVLDTDTGELLWHGTVDGEMAQPAVRNGVLYTGVVAQPDGPLLAYQDCGQPACDPLWSGTGTGRVIEVAAAGDLVYAVTRDDTANVVGVRIYAADGCGAPTCAPLKTITIDSQGNGVTAIVSGGKLFVNVFDVGVRAYGLPTG